MDDLRWTSVFLNGWKCYFSSVKKSKSDKKKDVKNGQLADVKKRMKNWFKLHPFFSFKKVTELIKRTVRMCERGLIKTQELCFSTKDFFFICHQSSRTVGLLDVNPEAEQAAVPDRGALLITQAMLSLYILQDWAVSLTAWSFTVHRCDCPHLYHGPQGYCRPPVGHPSYIY